MSESSRRARASGRGPAAPTRPRPAAPSRARRAPNAPSAASVQNAPNARNAPRRRTVPSGPFPSSPIPRTCPSAPGGREIARAIAAHQVVIVSGETGSGKTTQLPKICLELGRGRRKMIGHTQPRRLAATSVAKRIAEELNTPMGELVGYQVRFNAAPAPTRPSS